MARSHGAPADATRAPDDRRGDQRVPAAEGGPARPPRAPTASEGTQANGIKSTEQAGGGFDGLLAELGHVTETGEGEESKDVEKEGHAAVDVSVVESMPSEDVDEMRKQQLAYALASLRKYNPDFRLTPEVVEIMHVFFDDLHPDAEGTISLRALFAELERLDPRKELVADDMRQLLWRDILARCNEGHERIDFETFCAWVMQWKEISPDTVQNVYASWAKQLALMEIGLTEDSGMFVVRSEELPSEEDLRFHISELLQGRKVRNRLMRSLSSKHDEGREGSPSSPDDSEPKKAVGNEEKETNDQEKTSSHETDATSGKLGSFLTVSKSFIAGGAAGIVAKSALAPVDRIKIMFQVHEKRVFSLRNAFKLGREIYIQDGFQALFRGNMLNILRVVPYAGVQHSSFDFFRRKFHAYNQSHVENGGNSTRDLTKLSNMQLIAAGSLAGGLSLTISYPLDIVRARYMVQLGKNKYTSLYQAVNEMYKIEGARSFTRGLLPSLLGTLPYTGIGFTLNEKFKHWMLDLQQRKAQSRRPDDDIPARLHPFSKFLCSYFAACIAQTTTYPLDTIRRRIQTDGFVIANKSGVPHELRYTGLVSTARIILANEGWRGFFKGVSVNWLRSPLATGISLTAYDVLKEFMGVEKVP
ncbi:hypothetical protein Poli38472_011814 [Pythium oligandrum]|uniref:Mitochondrial carrier protein n=1 Tax=Pythium oligandrum TaxID=41045 RepID=A0A8K1C896_PYTOL|nr:hypothetical protein Poli38472_011814 [Pythium oligandrum]|eukprot:TMW58226.1 hypothetical protein Poli38472_011814 [Pythium oligandrum]